MPRDSHDRARSRSPRDHVKSSRRRSRSRSHDRDHKRRHRSHHQHHTQEPPLPVILPFRATSLSKHDLAAYKNLFASYLDIQKQKDMSTLDEHEVRGRWKSFTNKWNTRTLAEGWYDPATKTRADEAAAAADSWLDENITIEQTGTAAPADSDNDYGPAPAPAPTGPRPATFADLADRDESATHDQHLILADLRAQRKADRKQQKDQLDELAPKAEAGTRERQLEKRREAAATNKAYREAAGDGMADVGEADMMGGGGGGLDDIRARKKLDERKKSERELRKLEQLRARQQEREERMGELRQKEAKTMDYLQTLAKERFGPQG